MRVTNILCFAGVVLAAVYWSTAGVVAQRDSNDGQNLGWSKILDHAEPQKPG